MRLSIGLIIAGLICSVVSASGDYHHPDHESNKAVMPGSIIGVIFLILVSAIVAGLTLSMLSMDLTTLCVLEMAGTEEEKKRVAKIIPIRKNEHLLLTSLLLTNTVLNESLPILFENILSQGILSIAVSTVIIVLMAEIIPQALFTKYRLQVGNIFAYPMRFLVAAWFLVAWPISKLLDKLCGKGHSLTYKVDELSALMHIHKKRGVLSSETSRISQNAISLQKKNVEDIMIQLTPDRIPTISSGATLTLLDVTRFGEQKYTKLFVCKDDKEDSENPIVGVLDLKTLESLGENIVNIPAGDLPLTPCLYTPIETSVDKVACRLLLHPYREHIVLVTRQKPTSLASTNNEDTQQGRFPKVQLMYGDLSSSSVTLATLEQSADNFLVYDIPRSPLTASSKEVVGYLTLTEILDQLSQVGTYENAISFIDANHDSMWNKLMELLAQVYRLCIP